MILKKAIILNSLFLIIFFNLYSFEKLTEHELSANKDFFNLSPLLWAQSAQFIHLTINQYVDLYYENNKSFVDIEDSSYITLKKAKDLIDKRLNAFGIMSLRCTFLPYTKAIVIYCTQMQRNWLFGIQLGIREDISTCALVINIEMPNFNDKQKQLISKLNTCDTLSWIEQAFLYQQIHECFPFKQYQRIIKKTFFNDIDCKFLNLFAANIDSIFSETSTWN